MKKFILFALLFVAGACGNQSNSSATTNTEAEPNKELSASKSEQLCGGYSASRPLTHEEELLLKTVTADLVGVVYFPESVATQIVAGTNYKFICTAQTMTVKPKRYKAEIIVYAPLPVKQQKPSITKITRISEMK